jgi:hypothetical protein
MEKKSVGLLELETAVLECFLEKTPLSPLGVKMNKNSIIRESQERSWQDCLKQGWVIKNL